MTETVDLIAQIVETKVKLNAAYVHVGMQAEEGATWTPFDRALLEVALEEADRRLGEAARALGVTR